MTLHLRYFAHSEIGLVRKNNQDSGYASPNMLIIADGMGGAAAGDLASALTVSVIAKIDKRIEGEEMISALAAAVDQANEKIADLVAHDPALDGMGTTMSGAMFDGEQLGLVHVGDSRAYLYRDDELTRLTHDHSWVQSLVDEGKISEEEAAYHPHRSLIMKVLNGQPDLDPDTSLVPVSDGDRLLFCSDGLCGFVDDSVIAEALALSDPAQALEVLISAAHGEGGIDNITIIVADVVSDADAASTDAQVLGAAVDREIPTIPARSRADSRPASATSADEDEDAENLIDPEARTPVVPAPVDDEEGRYAPHEPPRRGWLRGLITGALVLLVLAGLVGGAFAWTRNQYYVGADSANVAIYRGVPQTVGSVSLSELFEPQDIKLDDLPRSYADRVRGNITDVNGLDEARTVVDTLRTEAQACIDKREAANKPPVGQPPTDPNAPQPPPPAPEPTATTTPADPGNAQEC